MNWKWGEKKTVRMDDPAGGIDLAWESPSYGVVKAFDYDLEKARRVYLTLEAARDAFEGGRARYENATSEVKHLLTEANKAAMELIVAMTTVDHFFASPVSPLFEGDADGFLRFCKEWIARQGPPGEVLGNSSRGRSGSLPPPPPGTVETASDSSPAPVENPSGSGSGRTNGSRRKTARGASTS